MANQEKFLALMGNKQLWNHNKCMENVKIGCSLPNLPKFLYLKSVLLYGIYNSNINSYVNLITQSKLHCQLQSSQKWNIKYEHMSDNGCMHSIIHIEVMIFMCSILHL